MVAKSPGRLGKSAQQQRHELEVAAFLGDCEGLVTRFDGRAVVAQVDQGEQQQLEKVCPCAITGRPGQAVERNLPGATGIALDDLDDPALLLEVEPLDVQSPDIEKQIDTLLGQLRLVKGERDVVEEPNTSLRRCRQLLEEAPTLFNRSAE